MREISTYRKQHLGFNDINTILSLCRSEKQKLFIGFLSVTGLRISEATDIRLKDCRSRGNNIEITIRTKKTNRIVFRKINYKLYRNIRNVFMGSKYLFETSGGKPYRPEYISNQIKKIGRRKDYDISANSLRHFYITARINKGDDLIDISRDMGHINLGSILQYYYTGRSA